MPRGLPWTQWNPGLHHEERTLAEVLATLPGAPPSGIPAIVRLFENPASKWGSPGAITLARHDCIHVILGRGLRSEDEAFVVGFTMGAATRCDTRQTMVLRCAARLRKPWLSKKKRDRLIRDWQYAIFIASARRLYRPPFRFDPDDVTAFRLGVSAGETLPVRDLQDLPFEDMMDLRVDEIRRRIGLDVHHLQDIYRFEANVLQTREGARLDFDDAIDRSSTTAPDDVDSGWIREVGQKIPKA